MARLTAMLGDDDMSLSLSSPELLLLCGALLVVPQYPGYGAMM
eukprot:gene2778-29280_t